ncbi:MAG: gamma-glutamyltransferase [Frondihabitans sp.]|nr:gamma-glutamyltransferase [Frondihabitans sp.]
MRAPVWAETLRRLVAAGAERAGAGGSRTERIDGIRTEWREGFVAQAIDAFVADTPHRHSTGADHRGVLDADDLAAFQASYEEPISGDFRGSTVFKAGAWTQGPILLETLALLAGFADDDLDLATEGGIHRVAEALKLALADRESYYGDGLGAAELETLIGTAYADTRRPLIGDEASTTVRPGGLWSDPYLPELVEVGGVPARGPSAGEPTVDRAGQTRGDTCHIDVVDRWGNIVSVTPSGGWLQSSPEIAAVGFCLGTRLQMTWLDERSPSALRPGKRPRTTLSPTMVKDAAGSVTALGTPGGDQQDQWQLLFLLRTILGGQTSQQAIDAPAFHSTSFAESFWPRTWTPGGLVVEERVGAEIIEALRARGHRVTVAPGWSLGRLSCVAKDSTTGVLSAAANPRGAQGYAVGR